MKEVEPRCYYAVIHCSAKCAKMRDSSKGLGQYGLAQFSRRSQPSSLKNSLINSLFC